jgi:hypothetical protein
VKICFIAGPYRGKTDAEKKRNIRIAEMAAEAVWKHGACALCPHLNSQFFSGIVPEETFLQGYLEVLSRCDCLLALPGWETSDGSKAEVKLARELKLPVFHYASAIETWLGDIEDADLSI